MHAVHMPKKWDNKIIVPIANNRLSPLLVMAMRKTRSNVLNPDKRRQSRNNERVALRRAN